MGLFFPLFFFFSLEGREIAWFSSKIRNYAKTNFFSARSKAVVALRASLPEWRGERSICEITKNGM